MFYYEYYLIVITNEASTFEHITLNEQATKHDNNNKQDMTSCLRLTDGFWRLYVNWRLWMFFEDPDTQAQKSSLDTKGILTISFGLHWQSCETTNTSSMKERRLLRK